MIEINLIKLSKLDRGTHKGPVKVTRDGKTFTQYRRVGKKEKPKTIKDLKEELKGYTTDKCLKGKPRGVRLPIKDLDKMKSILSGFDTVLGKYDNVKVNEIVFNKKLETTIPPIPAQYAEKGKSFMGRKQVEYTGLELNKRFIEDPVSWFENEREDFKQYKENHPDVKSPRWSVASTASDPIKSIIIHECWHVVYKKNISIYDRWHIGLFDSYGFTAKDITESISEYSGTNDEESFAEVGAAIEMGLDVPENIRRAFEELTTNVDKTIVRYEGKWYVRSTRGQIIDKTIGEFDNKKDAIKSMMKKDSVDND